MKLTTIAALVAVMFSILFVSTSASAEPAPPTDQAPVCEDSAALKQCRAERDECRKDCKPAAPALPALPASKPWTTVCGVNTEKIVRGTGFICACLPEKTADGYVLSDFLDYVTKTRTVNCVPSDKAKLSQPAPVIVQQPIDPNKYLPRSEYKPFDPKGLATEAWVNKKFEERPIAPNVLPLPADQRIRAILNLGLIFDIGQRNGLIGGGGATARFTLLPSRHFGVTAKVDLLINDEPANRKELGGPSWNAAGSLGLAVAVDDNAHVVVNLEGTTRQTWRTLPTGNGLNGQYLGYCFGGKASIGLHFGGFWAEPGLSVCYGPASGWDNGKVAQGDIPQVIGDLNLGFNVWVLGK